jgi:glycosyltransferase involved in cell wall biosynthesis
MALAAIHLGRRTMRGRYIVGYWNWELPVVPENWQIGLRFVHEVWVPSNFTADAVNNLLPGGRGPRVRVVPYPVATAPPMPARLDRAAFGLPEDVVIVLVSASIASSMARKNPLAAIAAFRAAFGDRRDRLLVLKLGKAGHYPDDLAAIRAAVADASNIRIETRTFPSADNHAFISCCDIVLSLHRSEGFGLVPAEAMLLGKPVVATAWSGNMDYMDPDSTALVGYTLVSVSDPRGNYEVPGAVWAEPSVVEAAGQLRRLADSASLRAALGARGRAAALNRLGVGKLRDAVAGIGVTSALGTSRSGTSVAAS